MKNIPPFAEHLLRFIQQTEAPNGYDTVFSNAQLRDPELKKKPITKRTVAEVQVLQPSFTKRFKSSASGAYQFMYDTLKGLIKEFKIDTKKLFDEDMQDFLGYMLLKRRGYDDFIAGKIGVTQFALNLAKEWASFPVLRAVQGGSRFVQRGQSYYAGDGLNHALVTPEQIEKLLKTKLPGTLDGKEVILAPEEPEIDPKQLEAQFLEYLSSLGESREISLAKTKIEEAGMWLAKHLEKLK